METTMLIISLISMVATIWSCIIAVRAKNESQRILSKIENSNFNSGIQISDTDKSLKNIGDSNIINTGENNGVIAKKVSGGVKIGGK